jgi:hypothetical protein
MPSAGDIVIAPSRKPGANRSYKLINSATGKEMAPAFACAEALDVVAVLQSSSSAMVDGGPFPAISRSRTTLLGTLAIRRILRPVADQNAPPAMLPRATSQP